MKRIPPAGYVIAIVVALFVASQCHAQGTLLGIQYKHLTEQTAPAGHYWMDWKRLTSTTDAGDNATSYIQHYHTGRGHAFGLVVEVQKALPAGSVWAIEADVMAVPSPSRYRVGVGVVVGPYQQGKTPGYASDGFLLIPWGEDVTKGRVGYGLRIGTECDHACISIPGGQAIELSDDPAVGRLRFDPATGITGLWRRDGLLIWGVQQETGQQFTMRRF